MRKEQTFQHMILRQMDLHMQKTPTSLAHKSNSKWITDLNVTLKL